MMPADFLKFAFEVVLCALFFAMLEIQIEGPNGWATQLPTWRMENRWTRLFWDGKPLTGYHVSLTLFVIALAHMTYVVDFAAPFVRTELRIASFLILLFVLEDWLWFVLNPAYGLRRFKREHVWWHATNWWWIMPRTYWLFTPLALALYWFSWTA
jgi:hypothetical protein